MKDSVVTARHGLVLWRGKKESKDDEEYLVVKMPLGQICAPDLPLIRGFVSGVLVCNFVSLQNK